MAGAALLEAVPNFSEGRRPEVVFRIAGAASALGSVLDVHSDPDHHRSVVTIAGPPDDVVETVLAASREAIDSIDLRSHDGVHPRIGSVDVVPFVPLGDTSMETARQAAVRFAREFCSTTGVPVFYYGEAAGGRSLPHLRKEAFAGAMPDLGGSAPHPTAGATAVGARGPLVAFNVNLATTEVAAAREIAARLRGSSGGLRGVLTLGLALESKGLSQVSMNLTSLEATPIPAAYDAVVAAAGELGVEVASSEIVGLAPRAAWGDRTPESLQLTGPVRTLEEALEDAGLPSPS